MILNNVGNPAPCSEVCSGGGYGLVSQPSRAPDDSSAYRTAMIPPAAVRVVTPGAGFHWGDAGIGADGMLAVIVIGLGGALVLTHRRNQRNPRLFGDPSPPLTGRPGLHSQATREDRK
jgi:hypothetical protein